MSKNKWSDIAEKSEIEEGPEADNELPSEDEQGATKDETAESQNGALEHPSREEFEDQLMAAEEKANKNWNLAAHYKAELENLQRRTAKDLSNAHKFANEKIINELLNVLDSLEQSLATPIDETHDGMKAMREGVELTLRMFLTALEKFSVTQIDPVGETFDPNFHEAMSMQPDDKAKPNTVLMVLQKGYILNGRVIRPARVIVSTKNG